MYTRVIVSLISLVVVITIIVVVIAYYSNKNKFLSSRLTQGDIPLSTASLLSFISPIELFEEAPDAKRKKKNQNKTDGDKDTANKKTTNKGKDIKKTATKNDPLKKKHSKVPGSKAGSRNPRHRAIKPGAKSSRSIFRTRFRPRPIRPPKIPKAPKPKLKRVSILRRFLKILLTRRL